MSALVLVCAVQSALLLAWLVDRLAHARLRRLVANLEPDESEAADDCVLEADASCLTAGCSFDGPAGQITVTVSAATWATMNRLAQLRDAVHRHRMEEEIAQLEVSLEVPREERWQA